MPPLIRMKKVVSLITSILEPYIRPNLKVLSKNKTFKVGLMMFIELKVWNISIFQASTWHVYPLEPEYVGHNALAKHPGGLSLISFKDVLGDGRYRFPLR